MTIQQEEDPYAVLGLGPTATASDLRRAYHKLSLEWHPDRHMQSGPEMIARAEAAFKSINHAYVIASEALKSGRTLSMAPTTTQVRERTRQEEQLATIAHAVTRSRLMMVATHWNLNPHIYRRDIDLTRRILSDTVVFGAQAFPRGFERELPDILIELSLASEGAHVRSLLDEAMQVIIDHAPEEEIAGWEASFAPLGYRAPVPLPRQPVPKEKGAKGATASAFSEPRTALARTTGSTGRLMPRAVVAVELIVVGLLIAVIGPRLAGALLPGWLFLGIAVLCAIGALALVLLP